jgi:hypothetical protein
MFYNSEYQHIELPMLCISKVNDKVLITTKKVASRYFDDLSRENEESIKNTVDVRLYNSSLEHLLPTHDDRLFYNDLYFYVTEESGLDSDKFLKLFNAQNINDIFSNREIIFINRNPKDRILTGFVEVVDSYVGSLFYEMSSSFIIKNYYNLNNISDFKLMNMDDDTLSKILNEYSQNVTSEIIDDYHLSCWNFFILNFIKKYNFENKVNVIDIKNIYDYSEFPKIDQPSNKENIKKWMSSDDSKKYIDYFFKTIDYFLKLEESSYNELKKYKK